MAKTSRKQLIAAEKYLSKFDELRGIRVEKGKKEIIQQRAKNKKMSLNGYINDLIDTDLNSNK